MRLSHFAVAAFLLLSSPAVHAASCCGGGFAVPSLITGDDTAQATVSLSQSQVVDDVFENGKWAKRSSPEFAQNLKADYAHLISDRWQVGGGIPLVRRERETSSNRDESWGLGDASVDAAYEFLPEWEYSVWKPKGTSYLQLTAPTGKSANESTQNSAALDVTGRGFWSLGTGAVLTKIVYPFDFQSTLEVHRSFDRTVGSSSSGGDLKLSPGWGGSLYVGSGWSYRDYRFGAGLSWNYEDAIRVSGAAESDGSLQRYATGVLQAAYMISDEWAANATYSDQTLFGVPNNTTLSRTALVSLQKRWPR